MSTDAPRTWGLSARAGALLLVAATYAPSLGNGWVWDDHELLVGNPGLSSLSSLLLVDVWSPVTGVTSDLYRPLVMLTHALGQALWTGPVVEHLVNLGLHLVAVGFVAGIARRLGASETSAWLGAAVFGVHTGASEAVFWVTGRHDLVPAVMLLGGWLALLSRRSWAAAVLLGLAPFAKEPYLLTPLTVLVWAAARREVDIRALAGSISGAVLYIAVRAGLGLPLPAAAAAASPFGPVGAGTARLLSLLFVPASASATALEVPEPALGAASLLVCAAMLIAIGWAPRQWRTNSLTPIVAALPIWLPTTLAAARIGIVADRYAYLPFASLGVALAVLVARRSPGDTTVGAPSPTRLAWLAWLLPLFLAPVTVIRGMDWFDDRTLFTADLQLDPTNPRAAFHVAFDLHTRQGDCARAIPLYRIALDVEPRAATNLQSCLMDDAHWAEAAALGPRASTGSGAMNTSRAYAQLGDLAKAVVWAKTATERQPWRVEAWELYGRALANLGRWEEATAALSQATTLDPENVAVRALRDKASERARSTP